jgi:hypothetical protein
VLADEAEVEDLDVTGEMVQTGEDARKGLRELVRRSMVGESNPRTLQRHGSSQQGMIDTRRSGCMCSCLAQKIFSRWKHLQVGDGTTWTRPTLTSTDRPYSGRRYYVLTNAGKPVFTS